MEVTSSNYVFLPWVRQGAASAISKIDRSPSQTGVVSVPAKLRINQEPDEVQQQVRLYGPGDVTAIDPRQVIRTEPPHLATDFEPNYFPAIEFDRPDFPWLFTPGKADDANSLRPWLSLIVVRKQEGIMLGGDSSRSLPVLEIRPPAQAYRELPDLSESWAWAHAQVTGRLPDTASLKESLAGDPTMTLSRLLCPRRLQPLTDYMACVVPTFELGRKAGMGLPITPDDELVLRLSWELDVLKRAWDPGQPPPSPLELPVYYHWEFRTGTGRDFETLVKRLTPHDARDLVNVGTLSIDISHPGSGILHPPPPGTTLQFEGALRLPDAPVPGWPQGTSEPFKVQLRAILNTPWQAAQVEGGVNDPVVAPPIYGSWHAARHQVNHTGPISWLDELNLDPRQRVTASVGTQVVQSNQEELVASAWEQFGDLQGVNQLRRQAQLGQSVSTVYYVKHFKRLAPESLLKMFSSAKSRVVLKTQTQDAVAIRELLSRSISNSAIPDRAVSGTVRRLTSSRAAISRRFRGAEAPPIALLKKLNTYSPATPVTSAPEDKYGVMTIDRASVNAGQIELALKQALSFSRIEDSLRNGPSLNRFKISAEREYIGPLAALLPDSSNSSPVGLPDSEDARAFRKAAQEHHEKISYALLQTSASLARPMEIEVVSSAILESVNPGRTIPARVQASLVIERSVIETKEPLEPFMNAPEFYQPMYEALRDISQDFLLPGLEYVPADTAILLEPNPRFVESFMVGLNHEMGRELLWRNYPTDQSATYFRKFWDTAEEDESDIPNINGWHSQRLGSNVYSHSGKRLVLLLRCELLRKYPNAVIYAVAAKQDANGLNLSTDPQKQLHPLFRGTLKPDVTFLGFNLTKDEAIADPGWFFVIQQQPTEPRFGLDEADAAVPNPPSTWNDLSWGHMAATEEEWKSLSHASIKRVLPEISGVKWGRNGAHQAYITFQRPVRIAIHARQMIKT